MSHDLIVVGGGPAGAACARRAAQRGLDVVVIEKQAHPRRKACGGGFRPGLLDLLDFDVTPALDRVACGSHLFSPSRTKIICTRDMITGYLVRREVFDKLLLDKAAEAGAEVISNVEVLDITESSDDVLAYRNDGVTTSGKYLVGADGVNSRIARVSGLKPRWEDDEIGLCFEASVPMEESDILRINEGPYGQDRLCIQIYFGGLDHGYAWNFPKRGEVSLGMGCLVTYAADLKEAWKNFTSEFSERYSVNVDLSETTAMRVPLKGPIKRTITGRTLLTGDAAGFVSPCTGEGIYYAIRSGQIAADAVADTLEGKADHIRTYEQRWKKDIGNDLGVGNFLANLLFKKQKNMEHAIQMGVGDEVMRNHLTDLIGGLRSYSELRTALMKRVLTRHPTTGLKMLT
ncbi:MAG: geranylgeranyl reductase family protein [Candidatus Thorarchaeota archaeon]